MDTTRTPQPGPDPTADPSRRWQDLYTSERRKARILGATTVAASLLAVAAGAWGLGNTDSSGPGQLGGPGQFGPAQPGMGQQQGGNPVPAPSMGRDLADMLFNADGSVNQEVLQQFRSRLPGGFDAFLQSAVGNGELTQDQADALAATAGTAEEQV